MSDEPSTLLRGAAPSWLRWERITLDPGTTRADVHDEWRDALVVVERGTVVLEGARGGRVTLGQGAVLATCRLEGASLRNPAAATATLTVARGRAPSRGPGTPLIGELDEVASGRRSGR